MTTLDYDRGTDYVETDRYTVETVRDAILLDTDSYYSVTDISEEDLDFYGKVHYYTYQAIKGIKQ